MTAVVYIPSSGDLQIKPCKVTFQCFIRLLSNVGHGRCLGPYPNHCPELLLEISRQLIPRSNQMPLIFFKPVCCWSYERGWKQHAPELVAHITRSHNYIERTQMTVWIGIPIKWWDMRNSESLRKRGAGNMRGKGFEFFVKLFDLIPTSFIL